MANGHLFQSFLETVMSMTENENQTTPVAPADDDKDAAERPAEQQPERSKNPLPDTTTVPWVRNN